MQAKAKLDSENERSIVINEKCMWLPTFVSDYLFTLLLQCSILALILVEVVQIDWQH